MKIDEWCDRASGAGHTPSVRSSPAKTSASYGEQQKLRALHEERKRGGGIATTASQKWAATSDVELRASGKSPSRATGRSLTPEQRTRATSPTARSGSPQTPQRASRNKALSDVFHAFDYEGDNDGISEDELLMLGKARRQLGQKKGEWNREMTARLMTRIGTDHQGHIPEAKFVRYFEANLPREPSLFNQTVADFQECAKLCAQKRRERQQPPAPAPAPKPSPPRARPGPSQPMDRTDLEPTPSPTRCPNQGKAPNWLTKDPSSDRERAGRLDELIKCLKDNSEPGMRLAAAERAAVICGLPSFAVHIRAKVAGTLTDCARASGAHTRLCVL